MNHEFRNLEDFPGGFVEFVAKMQQCIHCGIKVAAYEDGTRPRWAEIVLEECPDCDLVQVAGVMLT